MFDELIRRWWIVALRGLAAVAIGVALFVARVETLGSLISMFGVLAIADGVFTIGAGLAVAWLPVFLEGVIGVAVGALTFLFPAAALLWFVPLVVLWALVTGLLELTGVWRLRGFVQAPVVTGARLLAVIGATSIVFGIVFGFRPDIGALTGIIGVYAIVSGLLLVLLALNLRTWPSGMRR